MRPLMVLDPLDDDAPPLPALPPCPFCGDGGGSCVHTVGIAFEDPNECLEEFPDWDQLDDLTHTLELKVPGATATLDAESGRERTWWLTAQGMGGGASKRMVHPLEVAKRSKFVFASKADDGRSAPCALFSAEGEAAREKFTGALKRCLVELHRHATRLGYEDEDAS